MTISKDLFLSILAMDSYSRGYNSGIEGLGGEGEQVGSAKIGKDSSVLVDENGQPLDEDASFYAIAYTVTDNSVEGLSSGTTIISYRGTDNQLKDPQTGWPIGVGSSQVSQAKLSAQFYDSIMQSLQGDGNLDTQNKPILTGHSLGGGLAGFIASLTGAEGVLFDNMAFEKAAGNATSSWLEAEDDIFTSFAASYFPDEALVFPRDALRAYAVPGEFLAVDRVYQKTSVSDVGAANTAENLSATDTLRLHRNGLLVIKKLGDDLGKSAPWNDAVHGWEKNPVLYEKALANLTNSSVAELIGFKEKDVGGRWNAGQKMESAIAYSALEGASEHLVFGNTGVRAFLDDINELAAILDIEGQTFLPNPTESLLDGLTQVIVQFAGHMAFQEVDYTRYGNNLNIPHDIEIKPQEGVLSFFADGQQIEQSVGVDDFTDAQFLAIDVAPQLWQLGITGERPEFEILGLETLLNEIFEPESWLQSIVSSLFGNDQETNIPILDLLNEFYLEGVSESDRNAIYTFVDKLFIPLDENLEQAAIGDQTQAVTSTDRASLALNFNAAKEIVGDFGQNIIFAGQNSTDLFSGGLGADVLIGGAGQDIMLDAIGEMPDFVMPDESEIPDGFYDDMYVGTRIRNDWAAWIPEFLRWWEADEEGDAVEYSALMDITDANSLAASGFELLDIVTDTLSGDSENVLFEVTIKDKNTDRISHDLLVNMQQILLTQRADFAQIDEDWLNAPLLLDFNSFAANSAVGKQDYDTISFEDFSHGVEMVNSALQLGEASATAERPSALASAFLATVSPRNLLPLLTDFDPFSTKAPLKLEGVERITGTDFADVFVSGQIGAFSRLFGGWHDNDNPSLLVDIDGGAGEDALIVYDPKAYKAGAVIDSADGGAADGSTIAGSTLVSTLNGGEDDDWVLAYGGEGAVTIGGLGRDWIFNASRGGQIYGDTQDALNGAIPVKDTSENADKIWYWPNVTMWDPQNVDRLAFFGFPLVGGSTDTPGLNALSGIAGIAGLSSLSQLVQGIFTDYFLPFMIYKLDTATNQLFVGNIFSFNFFKNSNVDEISKGWMTFKNYDEAKAVFWGGAFFEVEEGHDAGAFTGLFQYGNTLNKEAMGDLGMVFKQADPSLSIVAMIPGFPGGLNRAFTMIDTVLTYAGAASLLVKHLAWSSGKDPLVIDLDGDGIETIEISDDLYFDVDGDFFAEQTGWLAGDDGFLVLDKNANGLIDDINEMFGNPEQFGFEELADYDLNGDGKIDMSDLVYSELQVWRDIDEDTQTDEGELFSLEELGILSISVNGTSLDHTTPQGTYLREYGEVIFDDGSVTHAFEAIFEMDDIETEYRGESGTPAWLEGRIIDSNGMGEVTDFSIAMANDFDIAEMAISAAAAMTTPNLKQLRALAGDALGQWGYGLSLTRELAPVLTETFDGETVLVDRGVYVEDALGGYWMLNSGTDVLDSEGQVIARPTMTDILAQLAGANQSWSLEQMWSPSTRAEAVAYREAAPYLGQIVDGRFVIEDYGIAQEDGSWTLASGADVLDADGVAIAAPTVADILAQTVADGVEWRQEKLGYNPQAAIEVEEIGVRFIDGVAVDYTVEMTDRDGSFHVWARNLDRALELQNKFGTPQDFNLRNYEIDFDNLDEVGSTDDSQVRVELMTPGQFNFATSLIGVTFEPALLAGDIDAETGVITYAVNDEGTVNFATDGSFDSGIPDMIDLVGQMMDHYVVASRAFAVRMALQGGLSRFASELIYDVDTDTYKATGDRELAPTFEAIFAEAPDGYDAAYDYLSDWNEILWQIYPDYELDGSDNFFGTTVSVDQRFILQMVIPAYEAYPLDIDLPAIMNALSMDETLLVQHVEADSEVIGIRGTDLFYLSEGDQTYYGGRGADTYVVGGNFGVDVIEDVDYGEADELRFTSIKSTDVVATRDGQDLILTVEGSDNVLTVRNQFLGELNPSFGNSTQNTRMSSIVFADGVIWDRAKIALAVSDPQDSDQIIVGSGDMDVMDGGAGNDVLAGGAGGDYYVFRRGDGQDTIREDNSSASNPLSAGLDFLQFLGEDLSSEDISLRRYGEGDDLYIILKDEDGNLTEDTIQIVDMFDGLRLNLSGFLSQNVDQSLELDYIAPNIIERFIFEDGSSLDFEQITQRVLDEAKTEEEDGIYGFINDNTLDGGAGNDYLVGREGGDTYIYGADYGLDEIKDGDYSVKLFGSPGRHSGIHRRSALERFRLPAGRRKR